VLTGVFLIVLALIFYIIMLSSAPSSTDPAALMQLVGGISGAAVGLSAVFILIGLIGRKA
jgi:hypothetical protein